jgi:hypothetical protein
MCRALRRHPNVIPLILKRPHRRCRDLAGRRGPAQGPIRIDRTGFELLAAFRRVSGFVTEIAVVGVPGNLQRELQALRS